MAASRAQHVTTEGRSKFEDLESTKNVATIQASPKVRERRLVVISTENALSEEEVGVIITMSTYFMRIPGRDLYANCIERVNLDLDWGEIGETHLRVLVYP